MAIIRVQKDTNFTIIKNNIFLEKNISLKAKGLLTQMLSLPDTWDYTVAGLATLCRDGRDSIASALKELEKYGYVTRKRIRDEKGQLKDIEYVIREVPVKIVSNTPIADFPELESDTYPNPITDFPELDFPQLEEPVTESPTQLITKKSITKKLDIQSNLSTQNLECVIEFIKKQINYKDIINFDSSSKKQCDEIVDLLAETLLSTRSKYHLNGSDISANFVKSRLLKLTSAHIFYVLDCLKNTTIPIKNMRHYLFTTLYNAPTSQSFYYNHKAQTDMAEGRCR